jgi:hypothetical protein
MVPAMHRCFADGVLVPDPLADDAHICLWDDQNNQWVASTAKAGRDITDGKVGRAETIRAAIRDGARVTKPAKTTKPA